MAVLFAAGGGGPDSPPLTQAPNLQSLAAAYRQAWTPRPRPVFQAQLFPHAADPDVFPRPDAQGMARAGRRIPPLPVQKVPVQVDLLDYYEADAAVGIGDVQQVVRAGYRVPYVHPFFLRQPASVYEPTPPAPPLVSPSPAAARAALREPTRVPAQARLWYSPVFNTAPEVDSPPARSLSGLLQAVWRGPALAPQGRAPYAPAFDGPYDAPPLASIAQAAWWAAARGPWAIPRQLALQASLLDELTAQTAVPPARLLQAAAYLRANPLPAQRTGVLPALFQEDPQLLPAARQSLASFYGRAAYPQQARPFNPAIFPPVVDDPPVRSLAHVLGQLAYRGPAWPIQAVRRNPIHPEEGPVATLPNVTLSTPIYTGVTLSTRIDTGVTLSTPMQEPNG